jgi:hypothetical protein
MKKIFILTGFFILFAGLPLLASAQCYQGNNCGSYTYPVYYPVNYPVDYQVNYPVYYNQPVYYNVPEQCQCSSGPCCDGCHFMSDAKICNAENGMEYGCPWGNSCGSDVASRTRTKLTYCSGNSPICNGRQTEWSAFSSWTKIQDCGNWQSCSLGISSCQPNLTCIPQTPVTPTPVNPTPVTPAPINGYVKHNKAICSDNNVYWFDSKGAKNDIQKSCDDANSCTKDSCADGSCLNKLSCDGSTCEFGSTDYCNNCLDHCGNKKCDCSENKTNCPTDCSEEILPKINGIGFAGFIKNFFGSILRYWFIWLLIIILIFAIWVFFAETQGGGETALVYGLLHAVTNKVFWFYALGILIIILLLVASNSRQSIWSFVVFVFSQWLTWFVLGLIAIYFIFKFLNSRFLARYIVK